MKINGKKTAAVAIATVMSMGLFAGCDLVISNNAKNMNQIVAEVNITESDSFKKEFASLDSELVKKVIGPSSISKLDMIATFVVGGYSAYISYGYTYEFVFNRIADDLVEHQIDIQYAKAYFLQNGWKDEDGNEYTYNDLSKFNAAVKDQEGIDYEIATLKYFLTEDECKKVDYTTRVTFNNSIDSYEDNYIDEDEEEDQDHDHDVRTTPTGIDQTDSDYYDEDYRIYTGTGKQSGIYGSYEDDVKDGSTPITRRRAYNEFIANLKANNLIKKGENTSDIESLEYYRLESKNDYEDALLKKLTDTFTAAAEDKVDEAFCLAEFDKMLKEQHADFSASYSNLESKMNSVSDTSFVVTATGNTDDESAYGFVINILLPFSATQTDRLNEIKQDYGDTKGNKFVERAHLLEYIKATDQRGSWFRGETDYSFESEDGYTGTLGNASDRKYLFFEDYLKEGNVKYERVKNYLGKYTYNGTWDEETRKYKPKAINIDQFIQEMEGYLGSELDNTLKNGKFTKPSGYYNKKVEDYYDDGSVDYEQFVYYENAITFNGGFDANRIFEAGSPENTAFSIINELSFAYNTDTGGLNSYLGYAVSANKTNFVSEFEYAAQKVVKAGAGNYIVVPSDYGWHIIYCTFSFVDSTKPTESGKSRTPYEYNHEERTKEGTFSYLFYESVKADTAAKESSNRLAKVYASLKDSYTIYNNRFKDLTTLG